MRDNNALIPFIESRETWAFGFGPGSRTHECARFADGGAAAVTGRHPLARFTSRWTTRLGAARVIRRHGGMARVLSGLLEEIPPSQAQRGDIGMVDERTLVLFEGDTVVGTSEAGGLMRLPRSAAARAWSVGA